MKQYKIGEYAKYMGVTPDLLKHYEELGVITAVRSESGYRYYPFSTSVTLLECIRLRNYGMTLREIKSIITDHSVKTQDVFGQLDKNVEALRQKCRFNEALIRDYEEFLEWREPLNTRDSDWCIRWSHPMYFLPHTSGTDFLDDPRIYEILQSWMSHIPIVKSALRVQPSGTVTWGFVIEQAKQKALGLPINDVVVSIPSRKVFYYQFRKLLENFQGDKPAADDVPAFDVLHSLGLCGTDEYYRVTVMPADWQESLICQYGYYAIALA